MRIEYDYDNYGSLFIDGIQNDKPLRSTIHSFFVNHFQKPPSKIFQKFCVSMEYAIGLCW